MNKFIVTCAIVSGASLFLATLAWIFSPSLPTVQLSAKEWMCVESVPKGLTAECTVYNRVATKTTKQ